MNDQAEIPADLLPSTTEDIKLPVVPAEKPYVESKKELDAICADLGLVSTNGGAFIAVCKRAGVELQDQGVIETQRGLLVLTQEKALRTIARLDKRLEEKITVKEAVEVARAQGYLMAQTTKSAQVVLEDEQSNKRQTPGPTGTKNRTFLPGAVIHGNVQLNVTPEKPVAQLPQTG